MDLKMHQLNQHEVEMVSGGMKWEGEQMSDNVVDRRGVLSTDGNGNTLWGDTFFRYTGIDWFM
jgi:hypothetical protein